MRLDPYIFLVEGQPAARAQRINTHSSNEAYGTNIDANHTEFKQQIHESSGLHCTLGKPSWKTKVKNISVEKGTPMGYPFLFKNGPEHNKTVKTVR